MPKILGEPIETIQLRLYKRDLDILRQQFQGPGRIGVNEAIRIMVRTYVQKAVAEINNYLDQVEQPLSLEDKNVG